MGRCCLAGHLVPALQPLLIAGCLACNALHTALHPLTTSTPSAKYPAARLRWQINARTRMGATGTFDGISIYRLDRHGRVYQHEVTDVQLRDPVSAQDGMLC